MVKKRIVLLYLIVISTVILSYHTVSFSIQPEIESISNYIVSLSNEIYGSVRLSEAELVSNLTGEVVLRMLLSPWGELKDVYVAESSGNETLDNYCVKAAWVQDRYSPFPEALGEDDMWIDVPIIFGVECPDKKQETTRLASPTDSYEASLAMRQALDISVENHAASEIALDEVELARLKIREARRSLFPAASLNYLETIGKTTGTTQDFTDKEYKVKIEYPLYYGWRLKYAVDQAVANMKASENNYNKVLQDLRLEVEAAFYSYLSDKSNLRLQRDLLEEAHEIFDIAKKRFGIGLSTKAEFLQVDSLLKQIAYQVFSSENDATMAKLALAQAMNMDDSEGLEDLLDIKQVDLLDPAYYEVQDIGMTLEECMELAFKNRPDLKTREYMLEFNDLEHKMALSKDQMKVDLTGSYGRSGGAFETETLELGEDWYLGIKVTKPLGGNTLSSSYTEDQTSQKHGVSTRTQSISKSLEFGILNNLQGFSERKSSEIAAKKARDELENLKAAIVKEVKESYLNYKKGLVQIRSNIDKIRYKEEELKIAEVRAQLNDISYSELLQAYMSLTDEKSFAVEAIGSLYQSMARLNKATGYALFLDEGAFTVAKNIEPLH